MHVRNPDAARGEDGWATIETRDWHVHVNLEAVEADDRLHDGIARPHYARLGGASEDTLISGCASPQSLALEVQQPVGKCSQHAPRGLVVLGGLRVVEVGV